MQIFEINLTNNLVNGERKVTLRQKDTQIAIRNETLLNALKGWLGKARFSGADKKKADKVVEQIKTQKDFENALGSLGYSLEYKKNVQGQLVQVTGRKSMMI